MPHVHDCEIQTRFRDVNAGGHVDNVEAMRIVDEARIQFFRFAPLPLSHRAPGARDGLLGEVPDGISELVGSQRVDYHAEMRFAPFQPFLVRLWVSHVGRSSFTMSTEMRVAPDHDAALSALTTVVLWDLQRQRAWPMDEAVRASLTAYLDAPVALRELPG